MEFTFGCGRRKRNESKLSIGTDDSLQAPEELERQADGYFSGFVPGVSRGIFIAFDSTDVSNCYRIQPPGISLRDRSARR